MSKKMKFGSIPPQKKPFLPNLTCLHTQGSFCGFGCNPIYTLADLELGLAVIAHQDDGVNSLGFKEVTDQVIFSCVHKVD